MVALPNGISFSDDITSLNLDMDTPLLLVVRFWKFTISVDINTLERINCDSMLNPMVFYFVHQKAIFFLICDTYDHKTIFFVSPLELR